MISKIIPVLLILITSLTVFAQTERLTNADVIDMSKAGLGKELILKKVHTSRGAFDVTAKGMIELKTAGVDDDIIAAMMEMPESPANLSLPQPAEIKNFSESTGPKTETPISLPRAKTIALEKSSLQPSRQALEKELLKRPEWKKLDLTILRYKESADLYVEIGFVSGSWITHRYVYRVYDRRTGAVITAGETTSWGSLAENLARHIAKSLVKTMPV